MNRVVIYIDTVSSEHGICIAYQIDDMLIDIDEYKGNSIPLNAKWVAVHLPELVLAIF